MANEKLSQKSAATTPLTGAELLYAVQDGVSVSVTVDDVAARAEGALVGADGASAYEVAVANGFVGAEAVWLLSLIGADSTVPGPKGDTGDTGAGLNILGSFTTLIDLQAAHPTGTVGDAYIIAGNLYVWDGAWSDVGNIQGPQGLPGADGAQGVKGDTGDAGADSTVAGPQGIQGVAGETGPAGVGIPIGGTAGQVLAKVDATDYNSEWIDPATGSGLTNPMTTAGDIIIGGVAGAPTRLAKGTDGQVLTVVAGVPAYAAASGGSATIDWTSPVVVTDTANLAFGKHYIVAVTTVNKTLTLPEITAGDYGKMIVVEIAAATTKLITIAGFTAQVIDGITTRVMWASEVAQLVATTNGWTKVGGKTVPFSAVMRLSTNQTFDSLVHTKIKIDVIDSSNFGAMCDVALFRMIAPRGSIYSLGGLLTYASTNASAGLIYSELYVDGSNVVQTNTYRPSNTTLAVSTITTLRIEKNSIVELYGYFAVGSWTPTNFYIAAGTNKIILVEVPQW